MTGSRQHVNKWQKAILAVVLLVFYIPGYFFLYKEIGNPDYSLPGVVFGGLFTLFGLFGHSVLVFEKAWARFENNKRAVCITKYFFKILGTLLLLPYGVAICYLGITGEPDHYTDKDFVFMAATLREKPVFRKGSKSSTYLTIYINECTDCTFEPYYNKYVHYNTDFEQVSNPGDTVVLGMWPEDYEKYIAGTRERTYLDRHVGAGKHITVYYVGSTSAVYYSPEIHNYMDKENHKLNFITVIFGFVMVLCTIGIWSRELARLCIRYGFTRGARFFLRTSRRRRK